MAKLTYNKKATPLLCTVSPITARQGKGSECCEGLFMYDPVTVSFDSSFDYSDLFQSQPNAIKIETAYEVVWLLDIKSLEFGANGAVAIKFDKCIII
jgi:hypothetical protein